MYRTGNKKMLNMLILQLLEEYSDEEHRLTQQEILKLLKLHYDMDCDRRSVKNNIDYLNDLGYEISTEGGYYLMHRDFEEAELRLLIDSVLCSKNMTFRQAQGLINKLKAQGNRYFDPKVRHIHNLPDMHHGDNKSLFYVLSGLNDAISSGKKVSFIYMTYDLDFKLKPRRKARYIVNPYQMVTANGRYYLIGNYDKYDDISHYRIDRIFDLMVLDEMRKPAEQVRGLENGLNQPKHLAEHIYLYDGESAQVKLRVQKNLMSDLVDWFGKDFRIEDKTDPEFMTIHVRCNRKAMICWALQYGPYVEVLSPSDMREELQNHLESMVQKYRE